MKSALLLLLVLLLVPMAAMGAHSGDCTVTEKAGVEGYYTLACTGDGTSLSTTLDLSSLAGRGWYLYWGETSVGTGGAAPDSHTVTVTDYNGRTLYTGTAGTADADLDLSEDLPNYWPISGNINVNVTDIGSANTLTIRVQCTK